MNDQQHAFWLAYIRQLAGLMRLKDWEISLARTSPESPTADAQNFLHYGQRSCELSLPVKFFAVSPEQQRSLIVHELIHCHTEDLAECIRLYINNNGHMDGLIAQVYQREQEVLVDTLALTIAPFLPLPGAAKAETHVITLNHQYELKPNDMQRLVESAERGMRFPARVNGAQS